MSYNKLSGIDRTWHTFDGLVGLLLDGHFGLSGPDCKQKADSMARGRRVDKVKAATALELREKLGHSERQIAKEVGLPASTIHTILSKANGWDQIAGL